MRQSLLPLLSELLQERKTQEMLAVLSREELPASSFNWSFEAAGWRSNLQTQKRQRAAANVTFPQRLMGAADCQCGCIATGRFDNNFCRLGVNNEIAKPSC